MFETIPASSPDKILELMATFRADERENKLDLGVGVYKDHKGQTPVMRAVRQAEAQLYDTQTTKTYVGPAGDASFCAAMRELVFGADYDTTRVRSLQTPGGSGALKVLADMLHQVSPGGTTWVPDPTWPNHIPLLTQAGHTLKTYRYYDSSNHSVDFASMQASLAEANAGDVILLHGCCHNPTGSDLSLDQWGQIADLCNAKSLLPFVDMAYQGFGEGLDEDAAGVRLLAAKVPEMLVAASCSKNLALYRERVGAALLVGKNAADADLAIGKLSVTVRANYSMPPDHGAAVSSLIFHDAALTKVWKDELNAMRTRMQQQRKDFAEALRKRSNSDAFDYIANQRGMFSRLPLSPAQIDALRDEHAIYVVGDGRVNIAGLPDNGSDNALEDLAGKIIEAMNT